MPAIWGRGGLIVGRLWHFAAQHVLRSHPIEQGASFEGCNKPQHFRKCLFHPSVAAPSWLTH